MSGWRVSRLVRRIIQRCGREYIFIYSEGEGYITMSNPRRVVQFEVRLPKNYIIDNLNTENIPLDGNMMVTIKEGHRNIGEMKLRDARRKYG